MTFNASQANPLNPGMAIEDLNFHLSLKKIFE
jgi:hypothetical protein